MVARPAVLPLVWLDPPACPLPAGLPAVADLAPAAARVLRLAVLAEPVEPAGAETLAIDLGALPGVAAAGWLETRRAVRLTRGRPVVVASRSGGAWHGPEASSPGHPAVLSAGRLRLALRAVP